AVDVDVEHPLPLVQGIVDDQGVHAGDAGAANEDVDAAHRRFGFLRGALDRSRVGDVDAFSMAARAEFGRGGVELRLIDVPQRHLPALGEDAARGRQANARCAARDKGAHRLKASTLRHYALLPFFDPSPPDGFPRSLRSTPANAKRLIPPAPSRRPAKTRVPGRRRPTSYTMLNS